MAKQSHRLRVDHGSNQHASFQRRHAHNYYLMGRQRAEDGHLDAARTLLERALALDPTMSPALLTIANLEFSIDRLARAREFAERALALDPQDIDALTLLGNIALAEHNPESALEAYRKALHCGGDAMDLHFNTALAYLFHGEAKRAEEIFARLTEEDETNLRAWDALGCARRTLKDYSGAVTAFTRALQLDPNYYEAREHLAQILLDTGHPQRAIQILDEVLAIEPERQATRHLLGTAYAAIQDYPRAIACWEELIRHGGASAELYHLLANAYIRLEDLPHAREALQTLVTLYPRHASGHLQLALLLMEGGELPRALRHLEEARALDPNNPVIAHALLTARAHTVAEG